GHLKSYGVIFFFSSRRRHTRSKRDWTSDVCSSDLTSRLLAHVHAPNRSSWARAVVRRRSCGGVLRTLTPAAAQFCRRRRVFAVEIGRASCREGVWRGGVAACVEITTEKRVDGSSAR